MESKNKAKSKAKAKPEAEEVVEAKEAPVESAEAMPEEPKPISVEDFASLATRLEEKIETAMDLAEAREVENIKLQERILRLESDIAEREDMGEYVERDVDVLHDPYDEKNAFQIVGELPGDDESPEGWVLAWKNPEYRKKRGMRGWIYMEYGDHWTGEDGELLKNYLNDPPERFQGPDHIDNYVRRADMILGRLKKNTYLARQQKRKRGSLRKVLKAGSAKGEILRDGVEITGTGLKDDFANRKRFGAPPPTSGKDEVYGGRTEHPVVAEPEED